MNDVIEKRSYKVVKANDLIQRAKYDLSLSELKMLAFCISKVKPADQAGEYYGFSMKEICEVMGLSYHSGQNYQRIKMSLKSLRDTSFYIIHEDGTEETVGWLEKVIISPKGERIKIRFDESLHKYIVGLFEKFTEYELLFTLPMKSSYSFRLYELLKSYSYLGGKTFEIEKLKQDIGAAHYKAFKDFRRRVLDVAIYEINEYTDIEVSYTTEKFGNKVWKIKFEIKQRDTMERYLASIRGREQIDGQISILDYERSLDEENEKNK